MQELVLKLYVTGKTQRALRAIQTAQAICARRLGGEGCLEVIDVLEQPQAAARAKILATPTLVCESPPPRRHIVGDLSDVDHVLVALGLDDHLEDDGR